MSGLYSSLDIIVKKKSIKTQHANTFKMNELMIAYMGPLQTLMTVCHSQKMS